MWRRALGKKAAENTFALWHPSEGLSSPPVQRLSSDAELRGQAGQKGPFLQILTFALWEEFGFYPDGELRHRGATESGKGEQPEPCARFGWSDGCLPSPLHLGHRTPGRTWRGLNLSGDLGWGLGLNVRVWTPFTSPDLSSWESHFFLYLAIKQVQPYRCSSKSSLKVNCGVWHVQKSA